MFRDSALMGFGCTGLKTWRSEAAENSSRCLTPGVVSLRDLRVHGKTKHGNYNGGAVVKMTWLKLNQQCCVLRCTNSECPGNELQEGLCKVNAPGSARTR